MWPFSPSNARAGSVRVRPLDTDFSICGQVRPDQMAELAAAGFRAIICARPDGEDPGQPAFAEVARAAEAAGLKVAHVPVSGMVSQSAFMRFEQAMAELPRPVLGYCRSGGRAATLYAMLR